MKPVTLFARGLALAVAPLTTWWWFDSAPAVSVDKVELVTPEVPRGGSLEVRYHITFLRRCSGTGNRYFLDAAHVPIPAESYRFRDGIGRNGQPVPLENPTWVPVKAVVPVTATPGEAHYQNVSDFYCNPLQRWLQRGITYAYPLIRFQVSAAPPVAAEPSLTAFRPDGGAVDLRERAKLLAPSILPPDGLEHEPR